MQSLVSFKQGYHRSQSGSSLQVKLKKTLPLDLRPSKMPQNQYIEEAQRVSFSLQIVAGVAVAHFYLCTAAW